jgi:IS30 family transposase
MAKDHRTPAQRDEHLRLIAEAVLRAGKTQQQIAAELKIDQSTVSRDLKRLRGIWRDQAVGTFEEHRAQAIATRRDLMSKFWERFEAFAADPQNAAKYLSGVGDQQAAIEKILGLIVTKQEHTGTVNTAGVVLYLPDNGRGANTDDDDAGGAATGEGAAEADNAEAGSN